MEKLVVQMPKMLMGKELEEAGFQLILSRSH